MWHYHQISIDDVLAGPVWDGIALCAFASAQDLSERFFGDEHDREVIAADVAPLLRRHRLAAAGATRRAALRRRLTVGCCIVIHLLGAPPSPPFDSGRQRTGQAPPAALHSSNSRSCPAHTASSSADPAATPRLRQMISSASPA